MSTIPYEALLCRQTPDIKTRAVALRQKVIDAVQTGKIPVVSNDRRMEFEPEHDTIIYLALHEPSSLKDHLATTRSTAGQREALDALETEYIALHQRLNNAWPEKKALLKLEKESIDSTIAKWLSAEEIGNSEVVNKAALHLKQYRSYNPPHLTHKKSFVEMIAEGESVKAPYEQIIKDILEEWSCPGKRFTLKNLATHLLSGSTELSQREIELWLQSPGKDGKIRDKVTEQVCNATGMSNEDEAMFWRVARGNPSIQIDSNLSATEVYEQLTKKIGAPIFRLHRMIGSYEDVMHNGSRSEDRIFHMPEAQTLLSFAQPSKPWLSQTADPKQWRQNWLIARKLSGDSHPKLFEDMIMDAVASDNPRKTLLKSILNRSGIHPETTESLQGKWQHVNPDGQYGIDHVKALRVGQSRPLTRLEAQVIVDGAREACPTLNAAAQETCIEMLMDCPPRDILIDRYIHQIDASGHPAKVPLKSTLKTIADSEQKTLTSRDRNQRFVPEVTEEFHDILTKNDRLTHVGAPLFANKLGLEGPRRRKFLVRAKGIAEQDPETVIDDVLGNKISAAAGLTTLMEQTGHTQTSFAKVAGEDPRTIMNWCKKGFSMKTGLAQHLANELHRPDLAERIQKTFCRRTKINDSSFEQAQTERVHHFQNLVASQIDALGQNKR